MKYSKLFSFVFATLVAISIGSVVTGNNSGININDDATLSSYFDLQVGDALLYSVFSYVEEENYHMQFSDVEVPNFFSTKEYSDWYMDQNELHSFIVTDRMGVLVYANETFTVYPNVNFEEHEHWSYDYGMNEWRFEWDDEYYHTDFPKSEKMDHSFDSYPDTLNLDIGFRYAEAYYVEEFTEEYTINGNSFTINITHLRLDESTISTWTEGFYDVSVDVTQETFLQLDYYIDNDTGFLIHYTEFFSDSINRTANGYSYELGTNIQLNDTHSHESYFNWMLKEANCYYTPISEVDLPTLTNYYEINYLYLENGSDLLILPLELRAFSNNLTVEISFLNWGEFGPEINLYDTVENVSNGLFEYQIPESEFEYNGPYAVFDIVITLYDAYNFDHNSTWMISVVDMRTIVPDWPSWYEGPDYIEVYEWQYIDQPYDVYSDGSWFVDIFRLTDDPYNPQEFRDHYEGYQNGTFWLHHPGEPIGEYTYEIVFWDMGGTYQNMTVTVNVIESGTTTPPPGDDTDPPVITGEGPEIYINQGEPKTLTYKITDANPDHVMVKMNGSIIIDEQMTSSPYYIYIDLDGLDAGTYIYSIDAWDTFDNHNIWDITVYVSYSGSNGTEPTNPDGTDGTNTFDLDAPNGVIVGLALFSISALTVLIKKKR